MDREILFKGCTVLGNRWIKGIYIPFTDKQFGYIIDRVTGEQILCYNKSIGQYTGLTDKNGKKIFEGDIVHGYWNTKFLIFFDLCCLQFRAKLSDGTEKDIDYYGDSKKIEVIGNIYDNPELLRSENG
nr:MAG TPA: YopX protein [Caudoviricetes sp.]